MHFSQILFPVDFSEPCQHFSEYVRSVASQLEAKVILLHAVPLPYQWSGEIDPMLLEGCRWDDLVKAEKQVLQKFCIRHFADQNVEMLCARGDPAELICRSIEARRIDLAMMPTHGYGPFRAALLGSVAAKVIHDTMCPLWTSPHAPVLEPWTQARSSLLCAIDGSESSVATITFAKSLADALRSSLTVVSATDQECDDCARARIEEIERSALVSAPILLERGRIAGIIASIVRKHDAGLVVIGRGHARRTLGTLRSHVYRIIRECPCPVVTV